MSIKFMNWAFELEGLTPFKKVIILALSDNANDCGECWPSIALLIKKTGIKSKTTIRNNINEMCDKGLMKKVSRNRDNGSKTSNKYILSGGSLNDLGRVICEPTHLPTDDPLYEPPLEPSLESKNKQKEIQLSIAKPKQEIAQNPDHESFEQALAQYSALAKKYGLRIPRVVSDKNEAKARKTIKALEAMGIDWVEYLRIIARSPHLLGKNDRNWKATFDWIINPTNFEKIVNGNYEQDHSTEPPTEDEKWQRRMIGLRDKSLWLDSWGERPGEVGCQVPSHILAQFGWDMAVLE